MSSYIIENDKNKFQKCFITTGISSLKFFNRNIQSDDKNDALLYSCMSVDNIQNISKANKYFIVIDLRDKHIKEILFNLLNYILPLNPEICIKIVKNNGTQNEDVTECMKLLMRLSKYNIINLDMGTPSTEKIESLKVPFLSKLKALIN